MDATSITSQSEEQREALARLTRYLAFQEALAERILLLIENRDHPAVDIEAWDYLIEEAKLHSAQMAAHIEALRIKLGIMHTPRLH